MHICVTGGESSELWMHIYFTPMAAMAQKDVVT